jgi:hypothetical protein
MKSLIVMLALLSTGLVGADEGVLPPPIPAKPEDVHQVMFLVTINTETGVWTHAQVIGGFKDNEACQHAAPMAGTIAGGDLGPNETPIILCPRIDIEKLKGNQGQKL